jgi:histidyl-tRNA synthetase
MKKRAERLRGMHDILPETRHHQLWITDRLTSLVASAGYALIDTPILENSDLFQASFGQELWQNLYAFQLHHRTLCLRPEYTASICRLYLDHYQQQSLPLRFQYAGPIFRYESPGRSRYRQHTQFGIELFGGHAASADAEMLQLACDVLHELSIPHYRLELGHIGVVSGFINRLQLDDQAARLLLSLMEQISRSEEGEQKAQARLEALYPLEGSDKFEEGQGRDKSVPTYITSLLSGLSISFGDDDARSEIVERFLWKMERNEQRRQILYALDFLRELHAISGPPPEVFDKLSELLQRYSLDTEPLSELQQLVSILEQGGVPRNQIVLNLSLGRGVSYYTGLVFEIHAQDSEGFDTQLCGGGRYDRLMRAVGSGRDISACGFAFGVERLLALIPANDLPSLPKMEALVVPVNVQEMPYALHVAQVIRASGMRVELDVSGHGIGSGLKLASKKHIPLAYIVGENERQKNAVTVHNMTTGEEQGLQLEFFSQQIATKGGVL